MPNPKSTSEIGESYENTGMAGLAARTAKSKYFLYGMMMMMMMMMMVMMSQGGRKTKHENGRTRLGSWRVWKAYHVMRHFGVGSGFMYVRSIWTSAPYPNTIIQRCPVGYIFKAHDVKTGDAIGSFANSENNEPTLVSRSNISAAGLRPQSRI